MGASFHKENCVTKIAKNDIENIITSHLSIKNKEMADMYRAMYEDYILAINAYEKDEKSYKMGNLFNKETGKTEMVECPIPEFEMELDEHKRILREAVLDLQPYLEKYDLPPLEVPFKDKSVGILFWTLLVIFILFGLSASVYILYKTPTRDNLSNLN